MCAGTKNLIRLHGSIWEQRCWNGCANGRVAWRDDREVLPEVPPRCPHCAALARPNIVWFGESLRDADIAAALQATACHVFLTVGTSAVVYPAAGLVHEAKARGAFTAEINLDVTAASDVVDVAIQGGAEAILPRIDALLR